MSEGGKVEDVLNFLQAFPPPAPKKDHIMVFFKVRTHADTSSSLAS